MRQLWDVLEKLAERGAMIRVSMWPTKPYVIAIYDHATMQRQEFYESAGGDLAELETLLLKDWGYLLGNVPGPSIDVGGIIIPMKEIVPLPSFPPLPPFFPSSP